MTQYPGTVIDVKNGQFIVHHSIDGGFMVWIMPSVGPISFLWVNFQELVELQQVITDTLDKVVTDYLQSKDGNERS